MGGKHQCQFCGRLIEWNLFWSCGGEGGRDEECGDGCGYADGDGNQICGKCAKSKKLVRTCGYCNGFCCKECIKPAGVCCGLNLCEGCTEEHEEKKRPTCGHKGCNYSDENEIECRTCSRKQRKSTAAAEATAAATKGGDVEVKQPATKKAKQETAVETEVEQT